MPCALSLPSLTNIPKINPLQMGIDIHPAAAGKADKGHAMILGIGYGHACWRRAAYHDGYAVADYLGHDLAGYSAA